MDARIILAGQPVDVAGSLSVGNQLAAQTNQLKDQNALRQVYRTQGAGILQGDQRSLNALAAIDPAAALGAQGSVLQNRTAERQFEIMNAEEKRAIAEAARQMDEAQRAQAAEAAKREVFRFIAAPTPEVFDQMVTEAGKPELRGQWANRQVLAADYVSSVEEALKLGAGPKPIDPTKGAPSGYMFTDPNNPAAGVTLLPGYEPKPMVQINPGESEFDKALGKADADTIKTISDAGNAAMRNLGRIDQLDQLLKAAPTGAGAAIQQTLGEWGIPTAGLSEIQAVQAAINALVPEQRQPGSGPMSDADLELFKRSLPRVINQPGGNQIIVDTMRAIAQYDAEGAVIAQRLRAKEISRDEAFDLLQKRKNPLDGFKAGAAQTPPPTSIPPGAIDLLKQNDTPDYRRSFDEIFGPGAAASVLGG